MHRLLTAAAVLALASASPPQQAAGGAPPPQVAKKAPPPVPPDYQKLVEDFTTETASVSAATKKVVESDEYKKAVEDKDRDAMTRLREGLPKVDRKAFGQRALLGADKHKGDDRARFLIWALTNGASPEIGNKAIDALLADHLQSPLMRDFVTTSTFMYGVAGLDQAKAGDRLGKVRASEDKHLKAWATYADGMRLQRQKNASDEDKAKAQDLLAEAEKLAAGTDLADRIAAPRFEKERLQIGMESPDIAGDDLDGVAFKLSDYRGKVVVVDFWGDW